MRGRVQVTRGDLLAAGRVENPLISGRTWSLVLCSVVIMSSLKCEQSGLLLPQPSRRAADIWRREEIKKERNQISKYVL